MYMVKCSSGYWEFVLELRNNMRHFFFNTSIIRKEEHEGFMQKWSDHYFVCISDKEMMMMGWVGVVDNDIRVAVAPEFHKKGVGRFMLEFIKDRYPDASAQILSTNTASIRLFESAKIPLEIIE